MSIDLEHLVLAENPDAVILATVAGDVLSWNNGAAEIFGYAANEAIGSCLESLIVPEDMRTEYRQMLARASVSGFASYETISRRKDQALVNVDVSYKAIRPSPESADVLMLCTHKDVSESQVLRDNKLVEARFRGLLESMPDAIIMANRTGRIVLANTRAEHLFGYASGELLGQAIEVLLPHALRQVHMCHQGGFFAQPYPGAIGIGLALNGMRKDGAEFPVEISLSPLHTQEGTLVMSAVRDISARKQIERSLSEKNVELQNAAEAKDRFLANMSHELRTPLNAIIGFTGTLLMRLPGPLNPDQQRQLTTIQGSAHHLLALINDLLDVAKIESGKVDLHPEPTSCAELLDELAGTLRLLAEHKGLAFELRVPDPDVEIRTDRRAVKQVLINLVNNAIKYTDAGSVAVTLERDTHDGRPVVRFRVRDTGVGIRPEDQTRLFQAFTQLDSSSTRRHDGTGLGLHLSQRLAVLLGGQITLDSELGRGSTFTLTLAG